jgi:hypothetical protein
MLGAPRHQITPEPPKVVARSVIQIAVQPNHRARLVESDALQPEVPLIKFRPKVLQLLSEPPMVVGYLALAYVNDLRLWT